MRERILAAALSVAFIGFVPSLAMAQTTPGDKLAALETKFFNEFLNEAPEAAVFLGDYSRAGQLSDPSPQAIERQKKMLADFERELNAIDMTGATLHDRNDMTLMRAELASDKRQFEEQLQGKDPSGPPQTIVGVTYIMILHKDEMDPATWWDDMIALLEKAPAWMTAQKHWITHPGKLQAQIAIKQFAQAPALYTYILTPMAASASLPADKKARFEKARDATVTALVAWQKWMTDNVDKWPQNWQMGATAYNKMLKDEQLLPYNSDDIAAIGQKTLDAAVAQQNTILAEAKAKGIDLTDPAQAAKVGGGAVPLEKDAQFAFFQKQLDTLRAFIVDKNVVNVPSYVGEIKMEATPGFLLPIVPGAFMMPPALLSKNPNGFYFIPPPNPDMMKKAAGGAIFEDFDRDRALMTSGHEGFPGHFLQLSIAKHDADPIRRFSQDGVFSEGWAFYEEDLLWREGLYGNNLDGPYAVAQFERLRGARAIVDVKLATGAMTYEQAIAWFKDAAGVDADTAQGEVSRFALGPGQAYDYAVGKTQIDDLLAKYKAQKGAAFDLEAFHNELLSHGTVPVSIIASEMLAQ